MKNYEKIKLVNQPFVGLENNGTRCYMNSLIQSLFHTEKFREHILNLPANDIHLMDLTDKTVFLEMQNLFRELQNCHTNFTNNNALKLALNWKSEIQEDAQDYYNKLLVSISEILQRYGLNNFVDALYRGTTHIFTVCMNCQNSFERTGEFIMLPLPFVLKYAEKFLEDFIISKIKNLKNLDNWFEPISIPQKQVEITTLITDLAINYHNNSTEDFPFLSLPKKRKHCTKSIDSSSVSRQVEKSSVVEKNLSTGLRNFDLRNRTEKFIEFFKSPLKKKNSRV